MNIPTEDFTETLAELFGPAVSECASVALAAVTGEADSPVLTGDHLGPVLGRALFPELAGVGDLPLSLVEFRNSTESVTLAAADAMAHALLGRWVAATFGQAIAAPVLAAITATSAAPDAPRFNNLEAVGTAGLPPFACCEYQFSATVAATAWFGPFPAKGLAVADRRTISAEHLFLAGLNLKASVAALALADAHDAAEAAATEIPNGFAVGCFFLGLDQPGDTRH